MRRRTRAGQTAQTATATAEVLTQRDQDANHRRGAAMLDAFREMAQADRNTWLAKARSAHPKSAAEPRRLEALAAGMAAAARQRQEQEARP